jgi:phosphopantothenoylcysteine decarboxylase / phosphopantothenate---cysteine ligase
MMQSLIHKQIIVGITGGIAAYKSADLVRRLREAGCQVRVVMTAGAKEFITPLTLQAVSGNPVHDDLFDRNAESAMGHIALARWADLIMVAPASADFMARLMHGEANDLLTTLCLATKAPIALAPAMNQGMWKHAATQENLQGLQTRGVHIFGPSEGSQACGDVGPGRMMEPLDLAEKMAGLFQTGHLAGKKIVITAGPTHEAIDPVRYLTNGSSGKMGYAMAEAAKDAGAKVILVSGPVAIQKPIGIDWIPVVTCQEMFDAVMANVNEADIFMGVAAVSDYRSKMIATQKIAKNADSLDLNFIRNPDIISAVSALPKKPYVVGFAAETDYVLEKARAKRQAKNMDMIIANQVGAGMGMGTDENSVTVIWENGEQEFALMSKQKLARALVALVGSVANLSLPP